MDIQDAFRQRENEKQFLSEQLLSALAERLSDMEKLLREADDTADDFYRFYHQSFKVYRLQSLTTGMVAALRSVDPRQPAGTLNAWFEQIFAEGTGKTFVAEHNQEWLRHTRPILEAFWHSREMLRCACSAARELKKSPQLLPSNWAAVLYLFDLR